MMFEQLLNAHEPSPHALRSLFKKWQKWDTCSISGFEELIDISNSNSLKHVKEIALSETEHARFLRSFAKFLATEGVPHVPKFRCYELNDFPGLFVFPSLLPLEIQRSLLNRLLHRDLSSRVHKTNIDLHYSLPILPHETSFFSLDPATSIYPLDAGVHKPLSVQRMLERRLRWITLGGQYDWTAKTYPNEIPPAFPDDIADLLRGLFPDVDPQAAILNFYSPGDTLSVHRDVSEECDRDLISISIGCDAIFLLGNFDGTRTTAIKLRSGDTIVMSGTARYAWHAVPKILPKTCPRELEDWPAESEDGPFTQWKGWAKNKRINLNVRQMRSATSN